MFGLTLGKICYSWVHCFEKKSTTFVNNLELCPGNFKIHPNKLLKQQLPWAVPNCKIDKFGQTPWLVIADGPTKISQLFNYLTGAY